MKVYFYQHPDVKLAYYKFGKGPKVMLCFHGYGMHGRQFSLLEEVYGNEYTFYGFDLFFHEQTELTVNTLTAVKKGLNKQLLAEIIEDFCLKNQILRFSMIAYSMGTHYASTLVERLAGRIDLSIAIAPSFLKPTRILTLLGQNKLANKVLEKLILSHSGLHRLLKISRLLGLVDYKGYGILAKEIATPTLRYNFYACVTYLRFLSLDSKIFEERVNFEKIRTIFIFGNTDAAYPSTMNDKVLDALFLSEKLVVSGGHELVNNRLSEILRPYL